MSVCETAFELLPERFTGAMRNYYQKNIEEIRLRLNKNPMLLANGKEYELTGDVLTENDLMRVFEKATGASMHSSAHQLKQGFIFYRGLRIGVCGKGLIKEGQLSGYSNLSSLNIRIPGKFRGQSDDLFDFVSRPYFQNTLIISPPGVGKTTLLRELITRLSDKSMRVGVVDERGELSSCDIEGTCYELGRRSDILTGINKSKASMMLLRGMNPQIIALDEITSAEDTEAIFEIIGCGVGILATAHSGSAAELNKRELYRKLLDEKIFKKAIEIQLEKGQRRYNCVKL